MSFFDNVGGLEWFLFGFVVLVVGVIISVVGENSIAFSVAGSLWLGQKRLKNSLE